MTRSFTRSRSDTYEEKHYFVRGIMEKKILGQMAPGQLFS